MNKSEPTPWNVDYPALPVGSRKRPVFEIVSSRGSMIATVRDEADAKVITRAVNAHKELLDQVEHAYINALRLGDDKWASSLRATIKAAKEGA